MRYVPGDPVLPVEATVRTHPARPSVVLTVDSRSTRRRERQLASALRGVGFLPVLDARDHPHTCLPRLTGLRAHLRNRIVAVHDTRCGQLFQLGLADDQPWPRAMATSQRVGLVVSLGHSQVVGGSVALARPGGRVPPDRPY